MERTSASDDYGLPGTSDPVTGDDGFDTPQPQRFRFTLLGIGLFLIALVAGLLLFGVLAGIQNGEEVVTGPPEAPAKVEQPPAASKDEPSDVESGTIHEDDADIVEPNAVAPPASLPPAPAPTSDVPAAPNAELVSLVTESQSPTVSRTIAKYQSYTSVLEVINFYQSELPNLGWSKISGPDNGILIFAKQEDGVRRSVSIEVTESGIGSEVTIQVTLPVAK